MSAAPNRFDLSVVEGARVLKFVSGIKEMRAMADPMWARFGAASGVLYVLLLLVAEGIGGGAGIRVELIGIVFLVPFLGYLSSVLRPAEGGTGWLSSSAFGAGMVAVAIKLASAGPIVVARGLEEGSAVEAALRDVNNASFILTMLPLGVVAAALGAIVIRSGGLPVWWGWLSAAVAVALLINGMFLEEDFGPAFLLFLLWVAISSVVLLIRGRGASSTASAGEKPR
jgi:hypothetical protein